MLQCYGGIRTYMFKIPKFHGRYVNLNDYSLNIWENNDFPFVSINVWNLNNKVVYNITS